MTREGRSRPTRQRGRARAATASSAEDAGIGGSQLLSRALIGRQAELQFIIGFLRRPFSRLLTISGPGGVGKTRLAIEVAVEAQPLFAEVRFIDLSPLAEAAEVLPAIGMAVDTTASWDRSLEEHLRERLGESAVLLVLDNFEHVAAASPRIGELLAASPKLKVLATSREPLRLTWEQVLPLSGLRLAETDGDPVVEPLRDNPAVALFVERARAVRPNLPLDDENVRTIAAICRSLDGLPLAIELAAARVRTLSPPAILDRLGSGIGLLAEEVRDAPARHQSLRAALSWSYDQLDPAQRALFRALAVFAGGFAPEAVAEVAGAHIDSDESAALAACTALAEKGLLVAEAESPEPRFRMLETIRAFAAEELSLRGERWDVRRRHADYYCRLAEAGEHHLDAGSAQVPWLDRYERELGNLRESLRWSMETGEVDVGLRLAAALHWFWFVRARWPEGEGWLRALLERAELATPATQARALRAAAHLLYERDAYAEASALVDGAMAIYGETDDRQGIGLCLNLRGLIARRQARSALAERLHGQALDMLSEVGDRANVARSLAYIGSAESDRGKLRSAERHCRDAVAQFESLSYPGGQAFALGRLAEVLVRSGDAAAATEVGRRAKRLADEVGYPWAAEVTLVALARAAQLDARPADARHLLIESLQLFGDRGSPWATAVILERLAELHSASDPATAATLLGGADRIRRSIAVGIPAADRPARRRLLSLLRRRLGGEGMDRAQRQGAAMHISQLLEVARQAPIDRSQVGRSTQRRGELSPRERQVADLIADGLSNREIAAELGIREATAEAHVQHILNKLGISRRSQIAAWTARAGLRSPDT